MTVCAKFEEFPSRCSENVMYFLFHFNKLVDLMSVKSSVKRKETSHEFAAQVVSLLCVSSLFPCCFSLSVLFSACELSLSQRMHDRVRLIYYSC